MRSRLLLLCCLAAQAHEIGTSRVTATFLTDRTYDIELVTDAAALAEKLRLSTDARQFPSLMRASEELFRKRVQVRFDDAEVRPQITYAVESRNDGGAAAVATIHFTGGIPAGARAFRWNFGWTFASYALTIHGGGKPATEWLEGNQLSRPFELAAPAPAVDRLTIAWRYLGLGFTHILPYGFDHVLFVLGIYLLSRRTRSVMWQVSAFTIAHSITLGLSLYGVVSVPSRVVEPLIAISIAYVAIENLLLSELKSWRIALVFGFGLLHGLGFAGALRELGLPRSEFLTALLSFNLGVEAGQMAVIGTAFLLVGWHFGNRAWYRSRIVLPASAMIACMAVYWILERLAA